MPLKAVLLLAAGVLLCGCYSSQPDYTPIGDGLKAIGICLVCLGVVLVLGDLVKGGKP
jgi:hypothetical protein